MVEEDCGILAMKLADDDLAELDMLGISPFDAMREGYNIGSLVGEVHGQPEAAFGVNTRVRPSAIWFLGSETARAHQKDFHKICKRWVEMFSRHGPLANIVPVRNRRTIRWLKALDFSFEDRVYNVNGHAFVRFHRGPLSTSLLH